MVSGLNIVDKIVIAVGVSVFLGMVSGFKVTINYTNSIPKGLYFIQKGTASKGEYTLLTKKELLDFATSRGYIAKGSYIGKKVAATMGDTVVVSRRGVYINNIKQPDSQPKDFDQAHRSMPNNVGTYILNKNEVFLLGETTNSFDSRYFGKVKSKYLKGILVPILTF